MNKTLEKNIGPLAAFLAFLSSFGFFQFAYPYHLIRREQQNLFLFDWDFIGQTYKGMGWLSRFAADFTDQFFHLPVAGPLIIALTLTGIGFFAYKIARQFLGKWFSLSIAAVVFVWSFFRETGNIYCTQYTIVVLGYLALVLAALQFRKVWMKPVAAAVLLAVGVWALGSPLHKHYGKFWNKPSMEYERMIGIDAEVARENWDKVIELSKVDLYMNEASYCYNLAQAMKGDLGNTIFNHSQNLDEGLLIRFTSGLQFPNCLAGEAWFHIGNMTIAEQSAVIALQASPKHTGSRFIERLAKINLISGEYGSAQKYLSNLSKTLFYGKWAREMLACIQNDDMPDWVLKARANLVSTDHVYNNGYFRPILQELLDVNPNNTLARDYLLCYDLLRYDLSAFVEDNREQPVPNDRIYQEALLIWFNRDGNHFTEEEAARYGISMSMMDKMQRFFRNPSLYKNTYWYQFMNALYDSNQ